MSQTLNILHAGSISQLVQLAVQEYRMRFPNIQICTQAKGSVDCIKLIKEGFSADVLISADHTIIEQMLMPQFTDWYVVFANNRMVLAGKPTGQKKALWTELLADKNVTFGYTDPAKDPCGYRTLMVWQLASQQYPDLFNDLWQHPGRRVYHSAREMLNDLQRGRVDYIFEYGSLAEENGLRIYEIDPSLNLSDPAHEAQYRQAFVVLDEAKGLRVDGSSISYALTIPHSAPYLQEGLIFTANLLNFDLKSQSLIPRRRLVGNVPPQLTLLINK